MHFETCLEQVILPIEFYIPDDSLTILIYLSQHHYMRVRMSLGGALGSLVGARIWSVMLCYPCATAIELQACYRVAAWRASVCVLKTNTLRHALPTRQAFAY